MAIIIIIPTYSIRLLVYIYMNQALIIYIYLSFCVNPRGFTEYHRCVRSILQLYNMKVPIVGIYYIIFYDAAAKFVRASGGGE